MKQKLLILILICATKNINAQISATTTAGKKVILNLDNKTWDWANPQDGQSPCYTNHTASTLVHNKTNKDIYFYYRREAGLDVRYYFTKIQADSTKLIKDLFTVDNLNYKCTYQWKVSYELYEDLKNIKLTGISGFDSGELFLIDCETREITIED